MRSPLHAMLVHAMLVIGLSVACSDGGSDAGSDATGPTRKKKQTTEMDGGSRTSGSQSSDDDAAGEGPDRPGTNDPDESLVTGDDDETTTEQEAVTEETACAATELAPEVVEIEVPTEVTVTTEVLTPVAIYILLDNSGSMDDDPEGEEGTDDSKWNQALSAISEFVGDPTSEGINVAIQYFHPGNGDDRRNNDEECDGSVHSQPDVDVGPLPDNGPAIIESLENQRPDGDTPTVGALLGGISFCEEYQANHADEKCVVVLVTDGQPRGCDLDSGCGRRNDCVDPEAERTLTPIAAEGASSGVQTFTVGMAGVTEEGFGLLNAIAVAGGTDCTPDAEGAEACDVSTTGSAGLVDALNGIREIVSVTETRTETMTVVETETLECQWGIPDVPDGERFNPTLVNVTLSIEGGPAEYLVKVDGEAECEEVDGGWYFDDPTDPDQILACPQSCDVIEAATDPVVQILLGCAPEAAHPGTAR